MKDIFKSTRFKIIVSIISLLLVGMLICAASGVSESVQSGIIGTVFTPVHWAATKLADGIEKITDSAKGNKEYNEKIKELQMQIGDLQSQLTDYNNLKTQNELYREALELKDENEEFEYLEASVIGRDSANPYCSFTISKGALNGVKDGDAVLYGKYLVGKVEKTYPTYSVVCTIIDPSFSGVSAYDITSKEISFVTGDAELAKEGLCKFENLDSATKISYGSIIATAGVTSTMPKGIVIGTVKEINDEETNISTYGVLEPGTDISDIDSCFVLTGFDGQKEAE
ncbi:MAG: rod shape-determining protein MreC [Eubacterium sp.]|nr:rod shape-determining protein MreC [Eubacterium sp.]